jgi:signal transduction histidine kinase
LALTALGTAMASERVGASVAAVAVAVAFAPLRARVQRLVDHVAYGDRRDPYRTISDLDRRLGEIAVPGEVLPTIVETVGTSLRLPYVGIEHRDGSPLATHGERGDRTERWRLVHEGKDQGFLVASPRRGEDAFDDRDRELLSDVARHAGVAVHAEVLTADLIASRQRLVTAREEERRRLRRDLHDGLGPTLTGIGLNLDAARSQLPADPEAAGQLIRDAKAATSEALADVRRLVYGLRPPALDNLGLIGAIERQTGQLATNGCRVRLDATNLPDLPAAIEVAAYRTVIEAVTNSIRHGHAHNCVVHLHAESDVLEIAVDDDGISTGAWIPGVGLLSMQELAAELDGAVEAGPIDGGGSRVSARYPIGTAEP